MERKYLPDPLKPPLGMPHIDQNVATVKAALGARNNGISLVEAVCDGLIHAMHESGFEDKIALDDFVINFYQQRTRLPRFYIFMAQEILLKSRMGSNHLPQEQSVRSTALNHMKNIVEQFNSKGANHLKIDFFDEDESSVRHREHILHSLRNYGSISMPHLEKARAIIRFVRDFKAVHNSLKPQKGETI